MADVRIAHTAHLDADTLAAARELLYRVFGDEMTEDDWEHALGGIHALAHEEGQIVGHASVVQRRLLHGGRALRTGYVEGVAVAAEHRRRDVASALMAPLEKAIGAAYDLGALGASDLAVPLYTGRGWEAWRGPLHALTPEGAVRTPDEEGAVYVLRARAELDLEAPLTADWRDGDVW